MPYTTQPFYNIKKWISQIIVLLPKIHQNTVMNWFQFFSWDTRTFYHDLRYTQELLVYVTNWQRIKLLHYCSKFSLLGSLLLSRVCYIKSYKHRIASYYYSRVQVLQLYMHALGIDTNIHITVSHIYVEYAAVLAKMKFKNKKTYHWEKQN